VSTNQTSNTDITKRYECLEARIDKVI